MTAKTSRYQTIMGSLYSENSTLKSLMTLTGVTALKSCTVFSTVKCNSTLLADTTEFSKDIYLSNADYHLISHSHINGTIHIINSENVTLEFIKSSITGPIVFENSSGTVEVTDCTTQPTIIYQ